MVFEDDDDDEDNDDGDDEEEGGDGDPKARPSPSSSRLVPPLKPLLDWKRLNAVGNILLGV